MAKLAVLEAWHAGKLRVRPPGDHGGHGFADPEIFDTCDRLNALPGVCTLQSCAGHGYDLALDLAEYPGNVWLWLDLPTARAFELKVLELARVTSLIERVSKHWQPDGQEVVSINFAGQQTPYFTVATDLIVTFFEQLHGR